MNVQLPNDATDATHPKFQKNGESGNNSQYVGWFVVMHRNHTLMNQLFPIYEANRYIFLDLFLFCLKKNDVTGKSV